MKSIVFILLAAIQISLCSGLFYLSSKNHDPQKNQPPLRNRDGQSIILLLFQVISYLSGWIQP